MVDGGRGDEDIFLDGGPLILGEESLHQVDSKGPLTTVHHGLEEMSGTHQQPSHLRFLVTSAVQEGVTKSPILITETVSVQHLKYGLEDCRESCQGITCAQPTARRARARRAWVAAMVGLQPLTTGPRLPLGGVCGGTS